jgi:CheY-specific phosphatase CheX
MPSSGLEPALFDSAVEVLETMFFTSVLGDASDLPTDTSWVSAELSFRGTRSGRFGVTVAAPAARIIAANFLGRQEELIFEAETGEVVCELANMLCGSVLSRLETEATFELSNPRLALEERGAPEQPAFSRLLAIPEGLLALRLELEQPR